MFSGTLARRTPARPCDPLELLPTQDMQTAAVAAFLVSFDVYRDKKYKLKLPKLFKPRCDVDMLTDHIFFPFQVRADEQIKNNHSSSTVQARLATGTSVMNPAALRCLQVSLLVWTDAVIKIKVQNQNND